MNTPQFFLKSKGATAKIKRGQSLVKGIERGQYPEANGNRLATPEPFLNSADADRMSVEGLGRMKTPTFNLRVETPSIS
jgi:hypothetical protein